MTAIDSVSRRHLSTHIFINFNPRYVDDALKGLDSTIQAAAESNIAPDQFVFEVVESDEIVDVGKVTRIVENCRRVGCRVALDDVGAGYNSLNLLAEVKPDFIKLDMDLVRDVESDLYKSRVASKLLELARELDVRTVLEGLETREGLQWAIEHGADFSQGFLFATPQPEPPLPSRLLDVRSGAKDLPGPDRSDEFGSLFSDEMNSVCGNSSAAIPR
jgi:EAL domain-containing protein (putative c-di-GMP-specific phosphodiesterase class I)